MPRPHRSVLTQLLAWGWLALGVACGESGKPSQTGMAAGPQAMGGMVGATVMSPASGAGATSQASAGSNTSGSGGMPAHDPAVLSGHPLVIIGGTPEAGCANYYPEILRAEGISSFDVIELGELSLLTKYAVAVLPRAPLSDDQALALTKWVEQGGRLLGLRPDPKLAALFGLAAPQGVVAGGYLQVDAQRWGVAGVPLQYHGEAELYPTLPGTRVEGQLLEPNRSSSAFPALTLREDIGPGGGVAAAFAFDLACSVILTRQGDPARAGKTELDTVPRSSELFVSFLDTENFAIPQADEQQRLFVNVLSRASLERAPLPRFWYLPHGRKLAVVMTGDDHNANGTREFFELLKSPAYSPAGCSAADWTCARATSWVYSSVNTLKNGVAASLVADGFELGPHVAMDRDGGCASWASESDLLARFTARRAEFENDYGLPASATNRSHCFVFADWDTHPKVESQLGIRLDENYTPYALPGTKNRLGHLNGSAMPMRFTDSKGKVLDIYQLVSDMDYEYFDAGTSPSALGQAISQVFDGALGPQQRVGFVGTHYDYSGGLEADFRTALLSEASKRKEQGVALISARQLVDWLELRNSSGFDQLTFDGRILGFDLKLNPDHPNPGLEAMLPARVGDKTLTLLEREGGAVQILRVSEVRSMSYAFFDALGGNYRASYQ